MENVRAFGFVQDSYGNAIVGKVFFYLKKAMKQHIATLHEDKQSGIVGPGTIIYEYTGKFCDSILGPKKGFFDLPGGLPPGEYALHVHYTEGGVKKTNWGHPFVITDGTKEQVIKLGYSKTSSSSHPFKEQKRILLFGDSDSSPKGETLSWRKTDVVQHLHGDVELAKAINCRSVITTNCAQGATPVAPAHMDHDGVTQVTETLSRISDADIAICRYGLNDCHSYMQNPIPQSREKFKNAYSECIRLLKAKNIYVILVKIQLEKRQDRRAGILAANEELEFLAKEYNVLLVDPSIEWENDKHLFHTDGIHLLDSGQLHVAQSVKKALLNLSSPIETPSDTPTINEIEFTYDKLDIGSWKETAKLRGVTLTGAVGDGTGKIKFDWNPNPWPPVNIFGDGPEAIGNPIVIVKKNGKWLAASFTWLRPNQVEKGRHEIDDPTIKQGPLVGWKPSKGETVYFMIAALCREGQRNVQERSNIVPFTFGE